MKFEELALSSQTLIALKHHNYIQMTDIQEAAIPKALEGKDILGAAKTGSGKTLAFLIPALEKLYQDNWQVHDGLGVLIITPTRELALQIFEVLKNVGYKHRFSAGLVIGGKSLEEERDKISKMNILIATPGRLLQHLDQTVGFDLNTLKLLILDEADKILELGFANHMNAILEAVPKLDRQTLLFSATQTSNVADLARLSLKNAVAIQVHEQAPQATPQGLTQYYVVCDAQHKFNWLYSFIRTHLKSKMLVFVSSCKQVRFFYEALCKLQPGTSVMALHGKQKQLMRIGIFKDFCKKTSAVMIATDIAARGLDFPAINWVIQLDCPDTVETYVHRVGRTARYEAKGNALLFLCPSEELGMTAHLKAKRVPIEKMEPNTNRLQNVQSRLVSICAKYPEIKYLGQKAVISYFRSIFLHGDKTVFDVTQMHADTFSESLGLASAPLLRFVTKNDSKNTNRALLQTKEEIPAEKKSSMKQAHVESEDDLLVKKSDALHLSKSFEDENDMIPKSLTKRKLKQKVSKGQQFNQRFVFDDKGQENVIYSYQADSDQVREELDSVTKSYAQESSTYFKSADVTDKRIAKEKRKMDEDKRQSKRIDYTDDMALELLNS